MRGELQRTTLSFILATFAVALSAMLGISQTAVSATTPDPDPVETAPVGDDAATIAELLRQLERTGPVAGTSMAAGDPTFDRPPPTATGVEPNTTSGSFRPGVVDEAGTTTEITAEATTADSAASTTSVAASRSTTTTETVPPSPSSTRLPEPTLPTPVTTAPDTMALRPRQAISTAEFRRFVDGRGFATTDYISPALVHGTIIEPSQRINVVLVHRSATAPMRVSPASRGREKVGAWASAIGGSAGINANWYGPFDGPAVSDGHVYGGSDHGYTALFGFTAAGDLVADHHHKVHDRVDSRVVEAVAGHPTLVHRGSATTEFGGDPAFTNRHPRTAIGVSATVDVLILVTVDGRQAGAAGMTGAETTRLLRQLGAHDAVMLDGGGSSAMWIAGKGIVNQPSDPGRAVGNQIAVFGR